MSTAAERSIRDAPSQSRRMTSAKEERALIISCPKCASRDAMSVEFLYRRGSAAHVPPPKRRDYSGWVLLATGSALLMLATLSLAPLASAAFGAVSGAAAWVAHSIHTYNLRRLPELHAQWTHSLMCSSCGEVFVPT